MRDPVYELDQWSLPRSRQHCGYAQSDLLWARAGEVIAGHTSTNSKRRDAFSPSGRFPSHIVSAHGCRVTDADGNSYIDFVAALAPIVVGYSDPRIDERVAKRLRDGVLYSLPCAEEVELAEMLVQILPCAEKVRFTKSGAEAVSAAVRIARATTGRATILSCGYHGWHDWFAGLSWPNGVPDAIRQLTRSFAFNDLNGAEQEAAIAGSDLACIVVTPALYGQEPAEGFLEGLRALCDRTGALLIFDEIITGFRFALNGAQGRYGVTPDLAAFGKAMANGMPLAAVAGRRDYMDVIDQTWITSTYASEALSIVAALETISILESGGICPRLFAAGKAMADGLTAIASRRGIEATISTALPAMTFAFAPQGVDRADFESQFIDRCAAGGVLIRRDRSGFSLCFMGAHQQRDIDEALAIFDNALVDALSSAS